MFGQNLSTWLGRSVQDYTASSDSVTVRESDAANVADKPILRFRWEYDDELSFTEKLDQFIKSGAAGSTDALVVGMPGEVWDGGELFDEVADYLISKKAHFPMLKALFFGDFIYEECECSWASQTDAGKILAEFPALEHFAIRGASISFSPVRNICLQSLSLETGGLPREIVTQKLPGCVFPELKTLKLMTGSSGYGWDGTVDDISKFLTNFPFPSVTELGMLNAEDGDELCRTIVESGILDQLETLDLGLGTVGDEGAEHLLESGKLKSLKSLKIERHYISEEMVKQLEEACSGEVVISDFEGDEPIEDRYVAIGE